MDPARVMKTVRLCPRSQLESEILRRISFRGFSGTACSETVAPTVFVAAFAARGNESSLTEAAATATAAALFSEEEASPISEIQTLIRSRALEARSTNCTPTVFLDGLLQTTLPLTSIQGCSTDNRNRRSGKSLVVISENACSATPPSLIFRMMPSLPSANSAEENKTFWRKWRRRSESCDLSLSCAALRMYASLHVIPSQGCERLDSYPGYESGVQWLIVAFPSETGSPCSLRTLTSLSNLLKVSTCFSSTEICSLMPSYKILSSF